MLVMILGYAKKVPLEKFDARALLLKLPIGAVIGLIAAWQKIPFTEALSWATTIGLVAVVDQVVKALLRRLAPSLAASLDTSGGGSTEEHTDDVDTAESINLPKPPVDGDGTAAAAE